MKTWTDCLATTVEQQIIFAQLEILRRLDQARVTAARAAARFVAGSLLTVAAVAGSSATGHAQSVSPERAFLNSASVAYRVVVDSKRAAPRIDGNRALLGRSLPGDSATLVLATRSEARRNIVTSEQAFLGRVEASNRRRVIWPGSSPQSGARP